MTRTLTPVTMYLPDVVHANLAAHWLRTFGGRDVRRTRQVLGPGRDVWRVTAVFQDLLGD